MPFLLFIKIRLQKSFSKKSPSSPHLHLFNIALTTILHSSPQPKTLIYKKVSKSKKKTHSSKTFPYWEAIKLITKFVKVHSVEGRKKPP